jgi:hypothetical protein
MNDQCGAWLLTGQGPKLTDSRWGGFKSAMIQGDIAVWVGVIGVQQFMLDCAKELRPKGVYCIVYESEAMADTLAKYTKYQVDEYWTYSWYVHRRLEFRMRSRWHRRDGTWKNKSISIARVVPPGFMSHLERAEYPKETTEQMVLTGSEHNPDDCVALLLKKENVWANEHIVVIGNIWSDAALAHMFRNHTLFLNRHRMQRIKRFNRNRNSRGSICQSGNMPLETFRVSTLLSGKSIVISVPSNRQDEDDYRGMAIFEKNLYTGTWSNETLTLINDVAARSRWLDRAFSLFKERFAPEA